MWLNFVGPSHSFGWANYWPKNCQTSASHDISSAKPVVLTYFGSLYFHFLFLFSTLNVTCSMRNIARKMQKKKKSKKNSFLAALITFVYIYYHDNYYHYFWFLTVLPLEEMHYTLSTSKPDYLFCTKDIMDVQIF